MLKKQTIPQNLNARLAKVSALEEAIAAVRAELAQANRDLREVRDELVDRIQDRDFWRGSAAQWQRKFEQAQRERNQAIEDMIAAAQGQAVHRPAPAGLLRPGRRGAVGEDAVLFQQVEYPDPAGQLRGAELNGGQWDAPAVPRPARPARHDEADMQQANARPARANAHPPGWEDLMARLAVNEAQLRGQVAEARREREQRVQIHQRNYPVQAEAVEQLADPFEQYRAGAGRQVLFDMEQDIIRVAGAVGAEQAAPDPFAGPVEPEQYDAAPPDPDEDPARADW